MASISDAMYSQYAQQMIGDLSRPLEMPVMLPFSNTALKPVPDGMEPNELWSTWRTGGSTREPADYPCALQQANCGLSCPGNGGQPCGKSLVLRENSIWPGTISSADSTGYVTTTWLPPGTPSTRIGFCTVSRRALKSVDLDAVRCGPSVGCGCKVNCNVDAKNCDAANRPPPVSDQYKEPYAVSQLFLDNRPLLHYWSGQPFLFRSESTPFIYMVRRGRSPSIERPYFWTDVSLKGAQCFASSCEWGHLSSRHQDGCPSRRIVRQLHRQLNKSRVVLVFTDPRVFQQLLNHWPFCRFHNKNTRKESDGIWRKECIVGCTRLDP